MATLALSLAGQVVGGAIGGPLGATIGRALGAVAGNAIDSALLGDKPAAGHADIRLQGSSEGGPIPRLYGWGRLAGNIIWATELEEMTQESSGSKGTSDSDESELLASFAVAFCEGEVARLGRIWADGQLLEPEGLNLRFYRGTEDQPVDSMIEAVQGAGAAPAYKGLCYLVFERLPLGMFGGRIPSISVELCRVVGELEPMIRSVTVIPGATEFGYDPVPRLRVVRRGVTETENAHQSSRASDWTLSIDELQALCPNLEHVSLVVAWFGDDLRAAHCTIAPRVEASARSVKGAEWSVAGLTRGTARVVSSHDGGPAYGGTPSDGAVKAAIADLRARGLEVTLYPIVLMDIAAGNPMGQLAYPWRGRIATEGGAGAGVAISAFVGMVGDWGYRRFLRHYAALAAETGADALIIGSELVGLTRVEDEAGGFPFVAALATLAGEAKALAPDVALTYAADWSEYSGFQPDDRPGDKLFPLDALWASPHIAAVGIDCYMPISDWRDGEAHADAADWDGPYDPAYLTQNIAGGEGYDWFYAGEADRLAGLRTPIVDAAHGEDWIWRFKDIAGWWGNLHHERRDGTRSPTPTAWLVGMKPIWFTELGCPAVDKGTNEPNRFPDAKSADGGRPWFSSGAPDGLLQRQALRAQLAYWTGAAVPVSESYGGSMVDPTRISLWCWDARPFPAFPGNAELWADARNHAAGHWLNGRLGGMAIDELIAAVAADQGVDLLGAEVAPPLVMGLESTGVASVRERLERAMAATALRFRSRPGGIEAIAVGRRAVATISDPVLGDDAVRSRRRPDPSERVGRLTLGYMDRSGDYLAANVTASRPGPGVVSSEDSGLVLDAAGAGVAAETRLADEPAGRDSLDLAVPPSVLALEVGDVVAVAGEGDGPFEITEIRDGAARRLTLRALPSPIRPTVTGMGVARTASPVPSAGSPTVVLAHLPPLPDDPQRSRLVGAAWASPWPGHVDLLRPGSGEKLLRLSKPASIGVVLTSLSPAATELLDSSGFEIELDGGHVADLTDEAVLAGGNRLAVATDAGEWEVLGFRRAELIGTRRYRLQGLLRGLDGSDAAIGPISPGRQVVVLDARVGQVAVDPGWVGDTVTFAVRALRADEDGIAEITFGTAPLLPLAPAHLRLVPGPGGDVDASWVRRSRADAGNWSALDVPNEFGFERYQVTVRQGSDVVRQIETDTPSWTYTAAERGADLGDADAAFSVAVAQLSPTWGAGHATEASHGA